MSQSPNLHLAMQLLISSWKLIVLVWCDCVQCRPSCVKCKQQFVCWTNGSFAYWTEAKCLTLHNQNFYPVHRSNMVSHILLYGNSTKWIMLSRIPLFIWFSFVEENAEKEAKKKNNNKKIKERKIRLWWILNPSSQIWVEWNSQLFLQFFQLMCIAEDQFVIWLLHVIVLQSPSWSQSWRTSRENHTHDSTIF